MIISDHHRFAFIHIPKCAGTLVRRQLKRFDKYAGRFGRKADHPELGFVDHSHLPLDVVKDHFPHAFEEVRTFDSFAIVREPYARYLSAVRQHLREFKRLPETQITERLVLEEAEAVMDHLESSPHTLQTPYIHFMPQHRYVFVGPEQIVRRLCAIDDLGALERYVRGRIRRDFSVELEDNVSRTPANPIVAPWLEPLRSPAKRVLPLKAKVWLWTLVEAAGVYQKADRRLSPKAIPPRLKARIADYYRADFALHASAAA